MEILAAAAALVLAGVHVFAPGPSFLAGVPRSVWLSLFGGVSVAYVFVHLIPELAEGQRHVGEALGAPGVFSERHVYLIAVTGLAAFYGLERLAKASRGQAEGPAPGTNAEEGGATSAEVFWIHMASFTLYNVLIGYLLVHRENESWRELALFALAMVLHFVVTDFGLNEDHQHRYRRVGRWILAAAVLAGLAAGWTVEVREAVVAVLIAFLAGGVILNVLKEEVPTERRSRFWAFALGIAAYSALLLAV